MSLTLEAKMPRKTAKKSEEKDQVAFRAPGMTARIDDIAKRFGLDRSNFLRMMITECLPLYERRADSFSKGEGPTTARE